MFSITPIYDQMSFIERIQNTGELPASNPAKFIQLLREHIDLPTLIQPSFFMAYYASDTNIRQYQLESLLSVMLLMQFFKFSSASNFSTLLAFSPEIRDFCRLPEGSVPDASLISKFKTTFDLELKGFFENLASHVMDIFTEFNATLPDDSPLKGLNETIIYDTTGLKPKVKENNPKMVESEVKRQSSYKKHLENKGEGKGFNVYLAAYTNLPKHASANESVKLDYANGHFGYFYKFGMIVNGFGIPLHIHFLDEDFYNSLPCSFASPEDQKYAFDNASLFPVMSSFQKNVGANRFKTFIGDSEFDSHDNYGFLNELGFSKVLIPINDRNTPLDNLPIPVAPDGIPHCPKDTSRPFIAVGSCKGENRSLRFKYICPDSRRENSRWVCDCPDKCRETNSTVTAYTYPSGNLRVFSGVQRGSVEWVDTYKTRTVIEREFSSMKSHPALAHPSTYNCASLRSDVYLNASAKLLTVILAFALGKPAYMKNINKLVKAAA